ALPIFGLRIRIPAGQPEPRPRPRGGNDLPHPRREAFLYILVPGAGDRLPGGRHLPLRPPHRGGRPARQVQHLRSALTATAVHRGALAEAHFPEGLTAAQAGLPAAAIDMEGLAEIPRLAIPADKVPQRGTPLGNGAGQYPGNGVVEPPVAV